MVSPEIKFTFPARKINYRNSGESLRQFYRAVLLNTNVQKIRLRK